MLWNVGGWQSAYDAYGVAGVYLSKVSPYKKIAHMTWRCCIRGLHKTGYKKDPNVVWEHDDIK